MDYTELEFQQEVYETGFIYDLNSLFAFLLASPIPAILAGSNIL